MKKIREWDQFHCVKCASALGNGHQISDIGKEATEASRSPISDPRYPKLTERGEVEIKGKGPMTTYWLEGA